MSQPEPSRADRDEAKRIADTINEHTHKVPHGIANMIASALAARGGVRVVRELAKAPKGSACWSVCSVDGRGVDLQPGQSLAIIEPAPTPQPVQQAEPKQSVQNFQWDGSTPRMDGTMVWFRSIDGSEHGWPQLTDHEAMRLVLFLHGSKQRSTPPPVAGDEVMLPGGKVHKIVDALSSSSQATGPRLQLVLQLDNLHEGMDVQRALKDSIPTAAESASRERDKPCPK